MLDENLPTFFTKPSSDNHLSSTIYLSENGSELQPEYTLRKPDPNLPASKNCYAVALYDSYSPDVLYAEVLVKPEWTQPTLSQAEIRAQNGVLAPPVPIVPDRFTIQLYNPDQQVVVRQIAGSTFTSAYWEFEMPENSFRVPSSSSLDRASDDPAVSDLTPKTIFKWKRDGKLSKDIACYLSGKSTDGKRNKEPDITVAMFKKGQNLTIYQPNMHRVEVEDVKGLEVVLLLGSAVIKDIFFNANREMFNISSPSTTSSPPRTKRKNSGPVIKPSSSATPPMMSGAFQALPPKPTPVPASQIPPNPPRQQQQQYLHNQSATTSRPPPADARTQWEIDSETERLKKIVEAEEKARERADREEQKRIKKMLEAEEKERIRRDAEVAKETERLRKQYGVVEPAPRVQFAPKPSLPTRPMNQYQSAPHSQPVPYQRPASTPHASGGNGSGSAGASSTGSGWFGGSTSHKPQKPTGASPYLQPSLGGQGHTASASGFFTGLGGGKKVQKKRSVFF